MRQFDSLGARSGTLQGDILGSPRGHPLAQPRGAIWVSLMTPSAQRRRGIAPKNIATFNTHTEALEPMAGATLTRYDAPSYARGWRQ